MAAGQDATIKTSRVRIQSKNKKGQQSNHWKQAHQQKTGIKEKDSNASVRPAKLDVTMPSLTTEERASIKHKARTGSTQQYSHQLTNPKRKPNPVPGTQEEIRLDQEAAKAAENTLWRCDEIIYERININEALTMVSRGALNQYMGNALFVEIKMTVRINAPPLATQRSSQQHSQSHHG